MRQTGTEYTPSPDVACCPSIPPYVLPAGACEDAGQSLGHRSRQGALRCLAWGRVLLFSLLVFAAVHRSCVLTFYVGRYVVSFQKWGEGRFFKGGAVSFLEGCFSSRLRVGFYAMLVDSDESINSFLPSIAILRGRKKWIVT